MPRQPLAVVTLGVLVLAVLWKLPQWQAAQQAAGLTPKELLLVEDQLRRTLILALGTGLAVAALLWSRRAAGERAARTALAATQETQRADRFARAVGELADPRLEVRLGAVYVLEQVAAESAAQHRPAMDVLCAFLRDRTAWDAERLQPARLPTDVQAALTVLGRRQRAHEHGESLDLRGTDLRGADLNGVHLERAILSAAHLDGAQLQGAHLAGANLRAAHLRNADLVDADLRGADLREAHLESAYLVDAHLGDADLGGAHLSGAYLGGANLQRADLGGAQLDGAYLDKAQLDAAAVPSARVVGDLGVRRDERERGQRVAVVGQSRFHLRRKAQPARGSR